MRSLIIGILVFFLTAQLFGIFTGYVLFFDSSTNPYVKSLSVSAEPDNLINGVYTFLYVLVGAVAILILVRYLKGNILFKVMEFGLISTSSSLVFYAISRMFLGYFQSMALGIVLGLILAIIKVFSGRFKNPAAILASAGGGAVFGISFGVGPLLIFILLLAIYDYLAVFKTKHMVEFANYMIKNDLSFTVTSKGYVPELKKESRLDLGTGDLIVPVMFEVSLLPVSPVASLFALLGALIFLGLFLFLIFRKKMVLPALPPIAIGMVLFFLIGKFSGFY